MKKLFLILFLLASALTLTSCKVNWFTTTVEVPWYVIAIPIALILVVAYLLLMSFTYVCPHCNTEFKAKPYQLYVTIHMNRKRLAKCPRCGKKSFCKIKKFYQK